MDRREMLFGTAALGLAARVDLSSFLNPQHIENGGELMPVKFRVSDRERAQLRGLVKTVVEGEWRKEYDLQGNLLSWRYKNPDGSDYGDSYTYDASGRLLMMVSRASDGTAIQKVHQYDDKGRLLTTTSSDGEHTTLEYDTAGHKTETRVLKETTEREQAAAVGIDLAFADTDGSLLFGFSFRGSASSFKTIYNERDQPMETKAYDADGRLLGRLIRTFDDEGRINGTKEVIDDPLSRFPEKQLNEIIGQATAQSGVTHDEVRSQLSKQFAMIHGGSDKTYAYDSDGLISKVTFNTGMLGTTTRTYAYNDHGDVILEHTVMTMDARIPLGVPFHVDESGKAIPDKASSESHPPTGLEAPRDTYYSYEYDAQGNWTEKTKTFSEGSSFTTRREITYY